MNYGLQKVKYYPNYSNHICSRESCILVTSTTCTTRMCIEYDYMHMHVRALHYMQRIIQSVQYDRK